MLFYLWLFCGTYIPYYICTCPEGQKYRIYLVLTFNN